MTVTKKIKQGWSELLLGEFTPHDIAFGLAVGTFIALLPTFGFSVFLAFIFALLFPHVNRAAIFLALIIWNPIVQLPIYTASFHLGSMLFAGLPLITYDIEILNQLYSFSRRFLVAHLLVTAVLTLAIYVTAYLNLRNRNLSQPKIEL